MFFFLKNFSYAFIAFVFIFFKQYCCKIVIWCGSSIITVYKIIYLRHIFGSSSLPSLQSASLSHCQWRVIQCPFLHWNSFSEHVTFAIPARWKTYTLWWKKTKKKKQVYFFAVRSGMGGGFIRRNWPRVQWDSVFVVGKSYVKYS